ncbi:MAG: methyltransferase domain-containing protein [Bacilli bacterium]|nr:methyltransferase domain-containing protein [Bacilli bacterium]
MQEKSMYSYLTSYLKKEEITSLEEEMSLAIPHKGFVIDSRKIDQKKIQASFPSAQPDEEDSIRFTYDPTKEEPGKNILHEAGAYYIMDPSGAEATFVLGSHQRLTVLDLCAAPGGKTISFALRNPDSLIVANDISRPRAEELAKNCERLGLNNVIVTSLDPKAFSPRFDGYFDLIILDAPCSGTGMFRKEAKMAEDWTYEKALRLTPIQDSLLELASHLLAKGGRLIYITCSFLKEEDEDRLTPFLENHKDFSPVNLPFRTGYRLGTIPGAIHLLPSLFNGEGHFFTLLKKDGEKEFECKDGKATFNQELSLYTFTWEKELWGLNHFYPELFNLPALRMGLKLTNHAPYAKCEQDHAISHYPFKYEGIELTEKEAKDYLVGIELKDSSSRKDGPYIVTFCGLGLGWVLKKGTRLHNLYPKGLRRSL